MLDFYGAKMRKLLLILAALALALALWCGVSRASGQSGWGANAGVLQKYTFANIPAERDGYSILITDGAVGSPCTGGGGGAVAVGINGVWSCLGLSPPGGLSGVGISAPPPFTVSPSIPPGTTITLGYSGQTCTNAISPCAVTAGVLSGDAIAGAVTFNLPVSNGTQSHVEACKTDSTANTVTLHRNGTDTINGAASDYVLSAQYQCVKLTDAKVGNWLIMQAGSLASYKGPVSITGTSTTGADSLSHVNINGIDNVLTFGAKGDGVTDDWAALMSAVAHACTNNRAVLFPPGRYKVLTPFA